MKILNYYLMKIIKILSLVTVITTITYSCDKLNKDERFTDDPKSWVTGVSQGELLTNEQSVWEFTSMNDWEVANHPGDLIDNSSIIDNTDAKDGKVLKIFTDANSQQRKKVRTVRQFGSGIYTWRTYISDLGETERVSIGSWLWNDDKHELDFEVGSGTSKERETLGLASDEVIAYITSQDNPFVQQKVRIKKNTWHTFQIDLKLANGKYFATWIIDGTAYAKQQLNYGEEYPFHIFCSTENLKFIGDTWTYQQHYGLWDSVTYTPYSYSMKPILPANSAVPIDPAPEPDEGETIKWNFQDNMIPANWNVWTNVGGDGPAYYKVEDKQLQLTNDSYCTTSKLTYGTPVSYGKYTWTVSFPELTPSDKFMAGGTLYTADEGNGYHTLTIVGWYGKDEERKRLGAKSNQLLLRIYSEVPGLDRNVTTLDPNVEYKLSIELKKVSNKYVIVYLLNNEVIQTVPTTYGADTVKFLFITSAESNRGWMPGNDISQKYTAKFSSLEYTAY